LSFVDWLRKGFGFVLLSMGVSRPAARPKSKSDAEPAPKPGDNSGNQSGGTGKIN
jgi:hypothetical protein